MAGGIIADPISWRASSLSTAHRRDLIAASLRYIDETDHIRRLRPDRTGRCSTLGMTSLVYAIVHSSTRLDEPPVRFSLLAMGLLICGIFVLNEWRKTTIMPLTFRQRFRAQLRLCCPRVLMLGAVFPFFSYITNILPEIDSRPLVAGFCLPTPTILQFLGAMAVPRLTDTMAMDRCWRAGS